MNLLLSILLCTQWVAIDSLRAIVNREKASEFWMDKDGNIRVDVIRNRRLYHYIISEHGNIDEIKGPEVPDNLTFLHNHADPLFCIHIPFPLIQLAPLGNGIILLQNKHPHFTTFLDSRADFPIYEYRVDIKKRRITYKRTIILPGKEIYALKLGTRYVTRIPGEYLRARLVGLGKDYALLLLAGRDKLELPQPPPDSITTIYEMGTYIKPAVYYLIVLKLQKASKHAFRGVIYKKVPITHEQTEEELKKCMHRIQTSDYVEGRDKNGHLYYVTFTTKTSLRKFSNPRYPNTTFLFDRKLLPGFAVKVTLTDKLKDLEIERHSIEKYMQSPDTSIVNKMKNYNEHFVHLNGYYYYEGRGLLNVVGDTVVFYYHHYMGKIVFCKGLFGYKMVKVEKIKSVEPLEMDYKDFKAYKDVVEMRFNSTRASKEHIDKDYYLYLHFLTPDGRFYHKKFLILKWQKCD